MAKLTDDQIESLSKSDINSLSASELDDIIERLDAILERGDELTPKQEKVYVLAKKYREELDKAGQSLEKNEGLLGKIGSGLKVVTDTLKGVNSIVKDGILGPVNMLAKSWGDADQAANNFGQHIGANAKSVARLRDESIKFANDVHIGSKYNASISEMIKLQESYSKSVGRNLQLTNTQRETLLATSKIMGDKAVDFSKKLENLGIGLERSGDLAAKMFNEASKSGISFEKYSTSVTENLTKVQSYGFKNGVEGLTSMAKRAAEVNVNIGEAFKIADRIQSTTGGIQEAIKMGANLQVLGGSFARMGDPMGLLYEGLNDVEGLQDRMVKMFSGLGQIENGQVKITGANRLRVNAAAEAMGISKDEMFNMINRQAVRGEVDRQMAGTAVSRDEELAELVRNTATLNKNNEAVVNIRGEERKLSEITEADKGYLADMQKSQSEDIKDIAQILRGYTEVQSGFGKEVENKKAQSFSEIGKFAKGMYSWAGKNNTVLNIIKDAVLAMAIAQSIGSIGNAFGRIGGGRGGFGGGRGGSMRFGGTSSTGRPVTANYNIGGKGVTAYGESSIPKSILRNKNYTNFATEGKTVLAETRTGEVVDISNKAARAGKLAKLGKVAGGAALGGVAGGAFAALGYLADGSFKGSQSDKVKAGYGTAGAAVGGALGSLLAPVIGPLGPIIGSELGKWGGEVLGKHINKRRGEEKEKLGKDLEKKNPEVAKAFSQLSDNYSKKELRKIQEALKDGVISQDELKGMKKKTVTKLAKNDKDLIAKYGTDKAKGRINKEIDKLNAKIENGKFDMETGEINVANASVPIEPIAMATGGKLSGPSDINGPGMPIQGTNIVVGGGEYVVNAEATKKNEPLLDRINAGATFKMAAGGIMPTPVVKFAEGGKLSDNIGASGADKKIQMPIKISNILPSLLKNPMSPLKVLEGPARKAMDFAKDALSPKVEVGPIKLDVSGTIKLDAGGKQVDLDSIINNPAFLTQLSQMIERRLSDNINGGNFKELRKNKRHTF